jgi:hypothetical protein
MRLHAILLLVAFCIVLIPACGGSGNSPTAPTYPTGKPSGLSATAGNQSATLNWSAVAGAAGYYVYMSTDGSKFTKYRGELITTTNFKVLGLTNGHLYYFGVSAVGVGGWETSISYLGGAPTATPVKPTIPSENPDPEIGNPPDPPANVQGVAKDSATELSWDYNKEKDFSFYRIYRRVNSSGSYAKIRDNYVAISFRNTDLTNDSDYSYYITAVDTEGLESDPSNIVTLSPRNFPPEMVKNLTGFLNPGHITLNWTIPEETDIAKYAVERVDGVDPATKAEIVFRFTLTKPTKVYPEKEPYAGGAINVWVDLAQNMIILDDQALISGTVYTYRVSAIDNSGQEGATASYVFTLPAY